jgi:hypothetical protein
MILIPNKQWKLDIESLHDLPLLLLLHLYLPVGQNSLHEQIEGNQEVYYFLIVLFCIEPLSKEVDFEYFGRKFIHFLLL